MPPPRARSEEGQIHLFEALSISEFLDHAFGRSSLNQSPTRILQTGSVLRNASTFPVKPNLPVVVLYRSKTLVHDSKGRSVIDIVGVLLLSACRYDRQEKIKAEDEGRGPSQSVSPSNMRATTPERGSVLLHMAKASSRRMFNPSVLQKVSRLRFAVSKRASDPPYRPALASL